MSVTTSQEQLRLIKSGDTSAFNRLFVEQYPSMVSTAFRYCQNEDEAKDMAQQSFIRFWEKKETINISESIQAYLRKMVINEALGAQRTKKRRLDLLPPQTNEHSGQSGEDLLLQSELKGAINQAISGLPAQCAKVFKMSRFESKKYAEIASELEISPKTVENHMGKALKLLRTELVQYLKSFIF